LPESTAPIRPQRRWLSRESGADREYRCGRHRNPSMMHAYPRTHALWGGVMGGLSIMATCGGVMGGLSIMATCGGVMGGLSIKATCGGVIGGLSNIAKAELAIAQPAIKATRLTFIMNAPNLSC
jgi:predicted lipid-binding transport protein (Tim44 family)